MCVVIVLLCICMYVYCYNFMCVMEAPCTGLVSFVLPFSLDNLTIIIINNNVCILLKSHCM